MKSALPIVVLIYFFNSFLLPHGLVWSALLAPVFVYSLYKQGQSRYLPILIALTALVSFIHFSQGARLAYLFTSSLLFVCAGIFFAGCRLWLLRRPNLEGIMSALLGGLAILTVLAIFVIHFEWGREILWYEVPISKHIQPFPRLKLFTYEAAYLALLIVPVALYYFWKIAAGRERHVLLVALAAGLPLLLTLSFGVFAGLLIAILVTALFFGRTLIHVPGYRKTIVYGVLLPLLIGSAVIAIVPGNAIQTRLMNITSGEDTSANGRIMDAFVIAWKVAESRGTMIGAGLGQIKEAGYDIIMNYYHYRASVGNVVRIPNSMAECLATFGVLGVLIKLALLVYLFVRTEVYRYPFNVSLFVFMFVYQFTGSYLVNPAEIILWAMAFYARPEFSGDTESLGS